MKTSVRYVLGLMLLELLFAAPPAVAGEAFDIEGKYQLVLPVQPTETPGKIEVVDVFWYGCPHCFRFLPVMEEFEADLPEFVEVRRMPAIFRKSWVVHAKGYYAALLLGKAADIHRPLFVAIHVDKSKLGTRDELKAFFAKFGIGGADFDATFDSFGVESLVQKSMVMQGRYGVRRTPSVIVNGKYLVSGSLAGSYKNMLKVIRILADKEHRESQATN